MSDRDFFHENHVAMSKRGLILIELGWNWILILI